MEVSRAHAHAIHDRVDAQTPATIDVYFGEVTEADADVTYPYLVVWPPPVVRPEDSLDGRSGGRCESTTQITGVGTTVDEVLDVLDRALNALDGFVPTIAGRVCNPIRQDPTDRPAPPQPDPQLRTLTGRRVLFGFINVRLTSVAG